MSVVAFESSGSAGLDPGGPLPLPNVGPGEELGDRIAELSAQIEAATYRLLVLLRQFDEQEGWTMGGQLGGGQCGFKSCAHWLSWRTGLDAGAARERVRVARALGELPEISAAMERGRLSYSKVRALTRIATSANEGELLELARAGTASHVETLVRLWRRADESADDAGRAEAARHARRGVTLFPDDDGTWVLRGRLSAEAGALLEKALERAEEELRASETDEEERCEPTSFAQRRADALGVVAETALSGDATPGSTVEVVLHVDAETLEEGSNAGQAVLERGLRVSAETSRRLSCDCGTRTLVHDAVGRTLDVGRRTRTVPPALRRALEVRDGTCRFPGCESRHCDAHHVQHWADGGETRLGNLVLLCRRHHRAVHEEGWEVSLGRDGEARFHDPAGRPVPQAPQDRPVATGELERAVLSAFVSSESLRSTWGGEAVEWKWVDWEALGAGARSVAGAAASS